MLKRLKIDDSIGIDDIEMECNEENQEYEEWIEAEK